MTNTDIARQIAAQHPTRIATRNGRSRPARIHDVQNAAKAAARELGLTGIDHMRFVHEAAKAALTRDDISTAGFGR